MDLIIIIFWLFITEIRDWIFWILIGDFSNKLDTEKFLNLLQKNLHILNRTANKLRNVYTYKFSVILISIIIYPHLTLSPVSINCVGCGTLDNVLLFLYLKFFLIRNKFFVNNYNHNVINKKSLISCLEFQNLFY